MKQAIMMLLLNMVFAVPSFGSVKNLLIIYDTTTSHTKNFASVIRLGAEIFSDVKTHVKNISEITPSDLLKYDGVIVGSPIHYGNVSSNILEFFEKAIDLYGKNIFKGKFAGVFMTGGSGHKSDEALSSLKDLLKSFGFNVLNETALSLGEGKALVELNQGKRLGFLMANKLSPEEHEFKNDYNLPVAPKPVGNYRPYVISQNHVYINQVALNDGKIEFPGVIEKDLTFDEAKTMTKQTMLNILAVLNDALEGDLTRVRRVVQLTGFFLSDQTFEKHADLLNVASNLTFDFFGEKGKHARAAIGASSLPLRSPVEIQAIIEINPLQ